MPPAPYRVIVAVMLDLVGVLCVLGVLWWLHPAAAIAAFGVGCLVIRRNL